MEAIKGSNRLTAPKRPRLIQPPKEAIRNDGKVATISAADKRDGWVYQSGPGVTAAEAAAALCLNPAMRAAASIRTFTGQTDIQLHGLVNELQAQVEAVNSGDMTRPEAMLVAQAHTLDGVFNALLSRAKLNMTEYPEAMERYLRLAFKAQTQCRATLETLGQLKNPSQVAFVKQANIAHGPQQVNNSEPRARAGKIESTPTKVLEDQRGKWMDRGAQEAAGRLNQALEAMGTFHRPQDGRGQSDREPQRLQGRHSTSDAGDSAGTKGAQTHAGRTLAMPGECAA